MEEFSAVEFLEEHKEFNLVGLVILGGVVFEV